MHPAAKDVLLEKEGKECCRDRLSRNSQYEDYPYRNQIRHTRRHEESMAIHEREKNSQMPSVVLLRILEHSITLTIKTIMLQGMLQYCRYMPCLYLETIFEYCKVIFIR